jgi:hypothetical protein
MKTLAAVHNDNLLHVLGTEDHGPELLTVGAAVKHLEARMEAEARKVARSRPCA